MRKITDGIYAVGSETILLSKTGMNKAQKHTATKIAEDSSSNGAYTYWGDDNLYPQRFMEKLNKTGAAIGGLDVLKSAHFGTGFKLFQEIEDESSGEVKEIQRALSSFPEIQEFFNRVRWPIFISDIIADYEEWRLAFPEYLLSPNGNKIISVKRHQAAWCRLGSPGEKSGKIDKLHINSDWDELNEDLTETVDFISPEASIEEIKAYCQKKKIHRFVIPVVDSLSVEKVLPFVKWHSTFWNGWVDVVLAVPELKKYIFENQLHVKYVVYIADDFMSHKYGRQEWEDFSAIEKEKKRTELVTIIDNHMSGNEAGGRSFTSPYFRDSNGNMIKGIEVVPIPNALKDGDYLPDASAGNSEILFPMGVDPCLLGAGVPGGKNLSGSGSDKREAYTILCTRMPIRRIRTIQPFNIIRDWNGWDGSLYGNFPNISLTTLDNNPTGKTTETY